MNVQSQRTVHCRAAFRRKALAMAIGGSIALAFAAGAWAQAVSGTIHGTVPAPGDVVQITGGAGYKRTVTVGPSGRYSIVVPVGVYTVTLLKNGRPVQSREDVAPPAAGGVAVDFASSAATQTLASVTVTANAAPPIDFTTTNQSTTITSGQLQALPLARSAENIALLSPGVQQAGALLQATNPTPMGTPALSFGGATSAENAYYVDGMNTTDPLTFQGGFTLPYGAILQQQTITSGYGAQYGRAIGGVISQVGKSGSNQWHFGVRAIWQPGALASQQDNQYWNNPAVANFGQLRTYAGKNSGSSSITSTGQSVTPGEEHVYDAYVSGPIIKDRLFFFVGVEQDNVGADQNGPTSAPKFTRSTAHNPKIYAKINWNINSSNIFTLTGLQNQHKVWSSQYDFNYDNYQVGGFSGLLPTIKNSERMWVANYTSYITDSLTLHAMFGKMRTEYWTEQPVFPGFNPALATVLSASQQDPEFLPPGSNGIVNTTSAFNVGDPSHKDSMTNYRVSLDWKLPWHFLGTHDISIGIDNITDWDANDGSLVSGPGYAWLYGQADPTQPLVGSDPNVAPYAGAPNSNPGTSGDRGYYATQFVFEDHVDMLRVVQRAQYISDAWQISPNFLATIGLRNDTFVNYNSAGQAYVKNSSPNWEPRLGFSWNAFGDNSLKVFGNAGRYYITMPTEVALRGAGSSTFTNVYGTYTGIDANGQPIGFKTVQMNNGGHGDVNVVGVSANNEYGEPLSPELVSSTNIKPEYQDNYVLGADWQFAPKYVAGVTAQYRRLGRILDDWDDQQAMCAAGRSEGFAYMTPETCGEWTQGAVLINPTNTSDLVVTSPSGALNTISVSQAQQGFAKEKMKRDYYSLDLSLSHPWDGKWFAKADLVWSRLWGNTEGPVDSTIGQGGASAVITEAWDFSQLMEWSSGVLPNDSKWQFKLYGAYELNPEVTLGANFTASSGHPKICLGFYGAAQSDPLGYATGNGTLGAYHYCGGVPVPPGSTGFTPWDYQVDVNANYSPSWQNHRLNFNIAIFNVFDRQTPLQYYYGFGTTASPNPQFDEVQFRSAPRYVRLTASYDF